jgi:iron(III) transport system substrate-binding protein
MKSLASVLTLAVVLVACTISGPAAAQSEQPPADLVAAAKKEGRLVYYSSEVDAINEAIANGFKKKYGIDVEWLRLASGPLVARFVEEQHSGGSPADVLRTADGGVFVKNPEWFLELTPELVPMLANYPESVYLENRRSVLTQYSTFVFTYNTNGVKEADLPKKWTDILDKRWKGRVVLSDPRQSISWVGWIDSMVKAHGIEFAHAVRDQQWDIIASAAPGAQQVAAGAYYGSVPAFTGHATPVVRQGAPLKFVTPTDPFIVKRDYIGILKGAKHPNAARLLLHYRLTREALEIACKLNEVGAPLPNVPGCIEIPESRTIVKDVWTKEEIRPLMEALGLPPS